jgi:hypothetical protein
MISPCEKAWLAAILNKNTPKLQTLSQLGPYKRHGFSERSGKQKKAFSAQGTRASYCKKAIARYKDLIIFR